MNKYLSVLHSLDLNPISFRHELECKLPAKPCLPTYLSNPYVNKRVQPPGSWLLTLESPLKNSGAFEAAV